MNKLFNFDKSFIKSKSNNITLIGVDEVGRGPAAGDVYACAYTFYPDFLSFINNDEKAILNTLNDSKKLSEKKRQQLYFVLKKTGKFVVSCVSVKKIEEINILNSALLAMKKSADKLILLDINNPYVLVDGNKLIKNLNYKQEFLIKGDMLSASVAAASIIAKVDRDNYMIELSKRYPEYNWDRNKGYLTKTHSDAIKQFGVTKYHRMSFLKNIIN